MNILAVDPGPTDSGWIRRFFAYDPESGLLTWKERPKHTRCVVGAVAGCLTHHYGYPIIKCAGKTYLAHRVAWFLHFGAWPAKHIDHVNRDKADNRITNLRECTPAENSQNRRDRSNSGAYVTTEGRFRSSIMVCGKVNHLGTFATPEEAHAAYLAAKARLHPFQSGVCQ